ncbi:MAG: putative DNA modification/repair radical SAM protein [Firmicutes bacterium]|nr:putative DNA modification/repair radical SAM protein [Bacillota bacterium]
MKDIYEKLKILADSAKYDVSCSTSGTARRNNGKIGNAQESGICHSWSADGRCISLLKVLFSNKCVYDCQYCVNRRSVECERASFEPEELVRLTIEFYRRNYIEGLFLSSAVEVSPDYTSERILRALRMLRNDYGFAGYIHAKVIPGTSPELVHQIGLVADRVSVNAELPSEKSLALLAPQKKPEAIFAPMKQITSTLIERRALKGPGTMFKNDPLSLMDGGDGIPFLKASGKKELAVIRKQGIFAPAGQTTQMIIGAGEETDRQIIKVSENIYRTFKAKRVYFSAYVPVSDSPLLPDPSTPVPLTREHRMYQADWLLRFYGFRADEILDEKNPYLDPLLDPKVTWALRNIERFPIEVNKAPLEDILRIPGIGTTTALRIVRQRRVSAVCYEDLRKMGVVLKRAKYFLTCSGKYYGNNPDLNPIRIRREILGIADEEQLSMFRTGTEIVPAGENPWKGIR